MATVFADLSQNYLPIDIESDVETLRVDGSIPPELCGTYMRNGPNSRAGNVPHPFFGDGMVHAVRLDSGRALRYSNRWVRTPSFERAETGGARVAGDLRDAVANTNVIAHAGRILTLVENGLPYRIDDGLRTIGAYDFGGRLQTPMTAHPKICPTTGEMYFFGAQWSPALPALTFHRADANGELIESRTIEVGAHTMMHDFAITERHVLFLDLPVVFDIERAKAGTMPFRWSDSYGARLGVMNRGGNGSVRWFEIEPCYIFHVLNAYDVPDGIVLDAVRYPELWRNEADSFGETALHRYTLDFAAGTVRESKLDDTSIEFPRVDERRTGRTHRYGYAVHFDRHAGPGIIKFDLTAGTSRRKSFGPNCMAGEATFVPAAGETGEDAGWLLTYVYDGGREQSDFVILDARDLSVRATVNLQRRVPYGFHGTWIDAIR
ncbi:MAG: carotenoid oxygenase family protein [Candidatus Eremiobacteraeota bacterium]|nr:carotenoid oxygenase family protein [Candidatus Eremiobacteraeota bacterium]